MLSVTYHNGHPQTAPSPRRRGSSILGTVARRADADVGADPRGLARWLGLTGGVLLFLTAAWWAAHPAPLAEPAGTARLSLPLGRTLYVGVAGLQQLGDHTLYLNDVTAGVTQDPGTAVAATWICRGGTVTVSATPGKACRGVDPADGSDIDPGAGDTLMVSLVCRTPGTLRVDPVVVTYRRGLQGTSQATGLDLDVTVTGRLKNSRPGSNDQTGPNRRSSSAARSSASVS